MLEPSQLLGRDAKVGEADAKVGEADAKVGEADANVFRLLRITSEHCTTLRAQLKKKASERKCNSCRDAATTVGNATRVSMEKLISIRAELFCEDVEKDAHRHVDDCW